MHLFSELRLQIGGSEIETIRYPGQVLTMLKALTVSDDYTKSQGLNQMWYKDTTGLAAIAGATADTGFTVRHDWIIKKPTAKGTLQVQIPLKDIFGFCEDYDKIIYGLKQELTLVRQDSTDAIFKAAAAGAGKITLDKVTWYVPHVKPNLSEENTLMEKIEKKIKLDVVYRMRQSDTIAVTESTSFDWRLTVRSGLERPRYVVVAFQTGRGNRYKIHQSLTIVMLVQWLYT